MTPFAGSPPTTPRPPPPALLLAQWLQAAAESIRADPDKLDAILLETGARLTALQRGIGAEACRGQTGLLAWQVERVRQLVEAGLQASMPVAAMAAAVRLSRSRFSSGFALSFGCTPHAYVQARRIARAKAMMRETQEPLAQIAAACGFADQAHLSRLFRQHMACTPSAWRRAQDAPIEA